MQVSMTRPIRTATMMRIVLIFWKEIICVIVMKFSSFPAIGKSWQDHWDNIVPFFDYPEEIRRVIYTTNAIESLNSSFRKISRSRNLFPSVESLYKLFYLAIQNISKKWTMPIKNWPAALNRFTIEFSERIPNEYKWTASVRKSLYTKFLTPPIVLAESMFYLGASQKCLCRGRE